MAGSKFRSTNALCHAFGVVPFSDEAPPSARLFICEGAPGCACGPRGQMCVFVDEDGWATVAWQERDGAGNWIDRQSVSWPPSPDLSRDPAALAARAEEEFARHELLVAPVGGDQ